MADECLESLDRFLGEFATGTGFLKIIQHGLTPKRTSMAQSTAQRSDTAQPRRATYQVVLDAPAHQVAEIIDGTLYTHPRPATPLALATSVLGHDLGNPLQVGRGGPGG